MLTLKQKRQLNILGYNDPKAKVRVRCFVAKGMPLDEQLKLGIAWQKDEKTIIPIPIEGWLYSSGAFVRLKKKRCGNEVELDNNGNPLWREGRTYQDGNAYLRSLNAKGYGIYLIPNSGGGADADITRFPALFYECDGVSKDEQWQRLRSLEAKLDCSASMVVETRNSLHCYFKLEYDKLLPSTWTQYQQRLIQEQSSDEAIWNSARLMRLVGFDHQKWNPDMRSLEQFSVQLAQVNENTFTLDEFNQVLPTWDEKRWQPRQQPSERIATDPIDNLWDIRNFTHYLDGYRADGRRGWDTCKCPAHNGKSDNSLHVEQSTGAYKCHAGCNSKDIYHAALELAKSRSYQVPDQRTSHQFSDLGGWLFKLKRQLTKTIERRNAWGFGRKGEVEVEPTPALSAPAIEYRPDERLDVWAEVTKQGYKYILDTSATGTGKSFNAGMATPELFGVCQLIYVSAEHRNPSTHTLESWPDLEARHKGLYRDEFGKLRRLKNSQPYSVSPNCSRNEVISALRSKNIPGTDTAELICSTCPHLEPCRAGEVFGFLHERVTVLKQPRLRAHPESLPCPNADYGDPYDHSNVAMIWDEAAEIIKAHRSIQVTTADLERAIADLAVKLPQVFDTLRPVLTALHPYLSGTSKQPKYGWKDTEIRSALPKLEGVDVEAIAVALAPDLDTWLDPTSEYGVSMAELKRSERKQFSEKDTTTATRIEQELALNWLPDLLNVLTKNALGHLRVHHGTLTITLPDRRVAEIAEAAAGNIFLDATATSQDLALLLGCAPEEILVVRQAIPYTSNLEIIQVATMGRLGVGNNRSEFCQKRVDAIINQIRHNTIGKVAVFDFKRHTIPGDGKRHYWVDSRGVNDLEDCNALLLVGVPCRNLNELEAEFTVLYNRPPQQGTERVKYPIQVKGLPSPDLQPYFEMEVSADLEFREFCRRRILADIHQTFGRLRACRRRNHQFKIYFIGDYPLDVPVTLRKASDITPEAATKSERFLALMKKSFEWMRDCGIKITQSATSRVSKELDPNSKGYSQQYLSRCWQLLSSIIGFVLNQPSADSVNPEELEFAYDTAEVLDNVTDKSPLTLVECLHEVFYQWLVPGQWPLVWGLIPDEAQTKILSSLLLTLPISHLRDLINYSGFSVASLIGSRG